MTDFKHRDSLDAITPYHTGKPLEVIKQDMGVDVAIRLSANENFLGPSPKALEALKRSLDDVYLYPNGDCYYLREKLAEKLKIKAGMLVFSNGTDELIRMLAETFINPGDEVIVADPTFPIYDRSVLMMGGIVKKVDVDSNFRHDIKAMLEAVNPKTRAVFLCSPNNPTGTIISRDEMDYFFANIKPGVLVVIDEAYCEYVDEEGYFNALDYLSSANPVVILRTFSKMYGLAGLRVGYAITSENLANSLERVRDVFNVNCLAQAAATAAVDDEEHVGRVRELMTQLKNQMTAGLQALGLSWVPSHTNFLFINLGVDSREISGELMSRGIIITSGAVYGFPQYARVTLATEEYTERFLKALAEIMGK
jgi:histidinol-phosphate aminotransferase